MVDLTSKENILFDRHSSKGNQLKWMENGIWYKADGNGYEGLAEYVCSELLKKSNLEEKQYVAYLTCDIKYKHSLLHGCESKNFLADGEKMITLERLFQQNTGIGLNKLIYSIEDEQERLRFLVDKTVEFTGLTDFGKYITMLLEMDMVFLNEDRHSHNIAVLYSEKKGYSYCPIFDNGACLLSDTTLDYPMDGDIYTMVNEVKAKLFSNSLERQAEIAESLYGSQLKLKFSEKDVNAVLEKDQVYDRELHNRVLNILCEQKRKFNLHG